MGTLIAFAAASGMIGLLFFAGGARQLGRAKFISGGGGTLGGGLLLALGAVAGLFGVNMNTYDRLTYEQPVATVTFTAGDDARSYNALVQQADGVESTYSLSGDAWQIDARVLKFKSWATITGMDSMYRLDRLSGRYDTVEDELSQARSVHALSENPGLDLWKFAGDQGADLGAVDASYGSGAYVPMADGAVFEVSLTQSGLIARPTNPAAEQAVQRWR